MSEPVVTPPNENVALWKIALVIGCIGGAMLLGWYMLPNRRPVEARPVAGGAETAGLVRSVFAPGREAAETPARPEAAPMQGRPMTAPASPPPRPRASPMAVYTARQPAPAAPPARDAAGNPLPPPAQQIAGMSVIRAETIADARYFLMPGDKITCSNNEPLTETNGASFSASINYDVYGREGAGQNNQLPPLIPRGSRAVGKVLKGMDHGERRLAAVLTHIEGPTVAGQPTMMVRLGEGQAGDAMGAIGLEGNIETHWASRLATVAAYAGLDAVSRVGAGVASGAINDAVSGNGRNQTNVNVGNFGGLGSGQGLAGQAFDHELNRRPSFDRPQAQACTIFINQPIDFRPIMQNRR